MVSKKFKKSLFGGLIFGLAAMLICTLPALAVEIKWVVEKGNWDLSTNWTNGVPAKGDDVIIDMPGADVTYLNTSNPTLNSLLMDPSDPEAGEVDLTQDQDILTVKNTKIGDNGTASYFHDGGTHKVLQDLTLGAAEGGEGYYYLGGGSLLVGGHETLGLSGLGILFQSPLPNSMASGESPSLKCTPPVTPPPPVSPPPSVGKNLYLGFGSGSYGAALITDSSLTVGGSNKVGIEGEGLFQQTNSIAASTNISDLRSGFEQGIITWMTGNFT